MITAVNIASRLVGFARTLVLSGSVGTEGVGSAYMSANQLPNILFEVAAGGALAGSIVPLLAGPIARRSQIDVSKIASAMLGWTLMVLVPVGGVLALAAGPIADILMAKHPELAAVTASFVRVFAAQIPLYGIAVVLGAVLQAHKRFFWQAFVPLLSSVSLIVVYLVFARMADGSQAQVSQLSSASLSWLAWGTTASAAVLALPLVLPVRNTGTRLRPTLRFPGGEGARARRLALAGVGVVVGQQLSVLAALGASYAFGPEETFPTFLYAQQVYLLPYAVLAFPLATSAFPRLAEHVANERMDAFRTLLATTTRAVLVVSGAGVAALMAAAGAVEVVFGTVARGAVNGLGPAVAAMAPGIIGYALILHLSRALYTVDRQRSAVTAASLGWLVVAAGSFALPALWGASSQREVLTLLGLASTIGMAVAGVLLVVAARRYAGSAAVAGVSRTCAVLVVGIAAGAGLGMALSRALLGPQSGVVPALGIGFFTALLGAAVVIGVTLVADRSAVLGIMRRPRTPAAGSEPTAH